MNDKISKYNIEIEYTNGIMLYNSLTNMLLPVKFKDYSVIETLLEHLNEFLIKYPNLYANFKKYGFIIPDNFDELAYIKLSNKRKIFLERNYHITINPTLDCNLKCWYCSVNYTGAQHNRERMDNEMIDALKKHILDLITRKKASSILLDWFGGEPMMYYDEVLDKISEYAKNISSEHHIKFHQQITTNATLLNENRLWKMKEANFTFFQISLDGNEKHHDLIKYYVDKKGTYRDIIKNINLITEIIPDASICLRINYDKQTLKKITTDRLKFA